MQHHSTVGLVTNSSSETFSMTKDKVGEILFGHLQSVLDAAQMPLKATDVFELVFEAPTDGSWMDNAIDRFSDSEAYDRIKASGGTPWDRSTWAADIEAEFQKFLADNEGTLPAVSITISSEDYDHTPTPEGAVFIRRKSDGQIDTALSAQVYGILDLRKNGDGEY